MNVSGSFRTFRVTRLVLTVVSTAVVSFPLIADDLITDPVVSSVEEYVAAISESVSSIHSLDCVFTIQFGDDVQPEKWRFARQGVMWHRTALSMEEGGTVERRGGVCFDGEYVYRIIVRTYPDGSEKWRHIEVQDGSHEPPNHVLPDAMLGSRLSNLGCSIVDAWEASPPLHSRDGGSTTLLAKNVPSELPDTIGMLFNVEYVTDESHGLVPSSIRIWESGKSAEAWFQHWVVDEWQQVTDVSGGTVRWFPVRGTLRQPGDAPAIQIWVESVAINTELPMSLFRPEEAPPGTVLTNATSVGRSGEIAVIGEDRAVDRVVEQVLKDTERLDGEQSRAADQFWLLVINGAVLVGIAVVLVVRRFRRSPGPSEPHA